MPATSRRPSINNGALFNFIKDPTLSGGCSATDTSGCFQDGGVIGKIPQSRLYGLGATILNRYPMPNRVQTAGSNYNYQVGGAGFPDLPIVDQLEQQPAIRLDYQLSQKLRVTGKYSGDRLRALTTPGGVQTNGIPGFTDSLFPYPFITNYAVTANYMVSPTMFLEGTYGFIRNELTGGNNGGILTNDSSNRLDLRCRTSRCSTPTRASVPSDSYALPGPERRQAAVLGRHEDQPAAGVRVGRPHRRRAAEPAATRAG